MNLMDFFEINSLTKTFDLFRHCYVQCVLKSDITDIIIVHPFINKGRQICTNVMVTVQQLHYCYDSEKPHVAAVYQIICMNTSIVLVYSCPHSCLLMLSSGEQRAQR